MKFKKILKRKKIDLKKVKETKAYSEIHAATFTLTVWM